MIQPTIPITNVIIEYEKNLKSSSLLPVEYYYPLDKNTGIRSHDFIPCLVLGKAAGKDFIQDFGGFIDNTSFFIKFSSHCIK